MNFLISKQDCPLTCVDYPIIMEEGGSEQDLPCERFDRFSDRIGILVKHVTEMGADNGEHQHVMFPVYSVHREMVQEGENMF